MFNKLHLRFGFSDFLYHLANHQVENKAVMDIVGYHNRPMDKAVSVRSHKECLARSSFKSGTLWNRSCSPWFLGFFVSSLSNLAGGKGGAFPVLFTVLVDFLLKV